MMLAHHQRSLSQPNPCSAGEPSILRHGRIPAWVKISLVALLGAQSTACAGEISTECEDGSSRSLACGSDGLGTQTQTCSEGAWIPPGPCVAPVECMDGATESLACGLNERGAQARTCSAGTWGAPGPCKDPDTCVDGASDPIACGLNGRGAEARTCEKGAWGAPGPCVDPDVCVDGDSASLACGLNGRGTQSKTCLLGTWDTSICADPDVCVDGAVDQAVCGVLGSRSRQCTLGQWGAYDDCNAPPSLTIAAPGCRDMVHDQKRHRLYITTSGAGGQVLSYDLLTKQFDAPLLSSGSFLGIDLSPDEDQLIVADQTSSDTHNWIYRIDLTTGMSKKIGFELDFYEAGTFTTVFTSNTEVLVTSEFKGSGWVPLRRVNLTNATVTTIANVSQGTMLTPSADGTTIAYAESNISSGSWGRYDTSAHTFASSDTGWFAYEIAVSRTAAQFAVPTYNGLYVFDGALGLETILGVYASELPVGAVYNPVVDEIYLAWYGASTSIDVYSSTSLMKLRDIAPVPGLFSLNGNSAFMDGRIRVSRDGAMVFATTGSSVVVYPTGA